MRDGELHLGVPTDREIVRTSQKNLLRENRSRLVQLRFPGPELRQHACAAVLRQAEEMGSSAVRAAAPQQPRQCVLDSSVQSGCPGFRQELEEVARRNVGAARQGPIENLTVRRRTRSGEENFSFGAVTVVAFQSDNGVGTLLNQEAQRFQKLVVTSASFSTLLE